MFRVDGMYASGRLTFLFIPKEIYTSVFLIRFDTRRIKSIGMKTVTIL